MGTAYAMRLLKQYITDKPFFMTNSDELKDIDLREFYKTYEKNDALACIALTKVEDPTQYGVAKMDGDRISAFVEKPTRKQAPSKFINSGLYIIHPSVMDLVPNKFTMTEKHIFPKLAKDGKLFGHKFDGQWFDTGTPERYKLAIEGWSGFSWSKK
jgi:NDP-sugar pyrophosphorylase family protein